MLSDRSASYPSSPTRRKAALDDTPLDTREAMLLPPPSDGLHGYGSRASAAAAEEGGASGLGLGGDEPTREPARRTVEPWGSLLLSDQDQEEDDAQVGKDATYLSCYLLVVVEHSTIFVFSIFLHEGPRS